LHSRFILLHPRRKALKFGEMACLDLEEPGVQPLPLAFVHHLEKVLREAISRLQGWMDLAQSCQVPSFVFIEARLDAA
jgi:hypothetical protein